MNADLDTLKSLVKMSAEDLEQAICGYIRYGEYNIDDIETSARGACRRMRND